jgi:inosine/xanthosine triphosphate pyrophosphatase family protein
VLIDRGLDLSQILSEFTADTVYFLVDVSILSIKFFTSFPGVYS